MFIFILLYCYRCKKCIYCPECSSSSVVLKGKSDPLDKSSIYFFCTFCKWRSVEDSLIEENATKLYASVFNREKDTDANAEVTRIIKNLRIKNEKSVYRSTDQRKILNSVDEAKRKLEVRECVKQFNYETLPSNEKDLEKTSYESSMQRNDRHMILKKEAAGNGRIIERIPLLSTTQKICKQCNKELVQYESNELETMDKNEPYINPIRESATYVSNSKCNWHCRNSPICLKVTYTSLNRHYTPIISFAIKRIFMLAKKNPVVELGKPVEISLKILNPYKDTIKVNLKVDKELSTLEATLEEAECVIEPHPLPHINDITYEWDGEVDPSLFYKQKGFVFMKFYATPKSMNDEVSSYYFLLIIGLITHITVDHHEYDCSIQRS